VLVNRSVARAKSLEDQIRSEGGEASAFGADVTQLEAMEAFAVERYGRLGMTGAIAEPAVRFRGLASLAPSNPPLAPIGRGPATAGELLPPSPVC